jgi:hypothetical protein
MQGGSSSKQESFPPNVSSELAGPPFIFYPNIFKINGPVFFFLSFFLSFFLPSFLPFLFTYCIEECPSSEANGF